MGNIGTPEILVVLIVALLILGPNRLPQAARQFGKAMAEFRRVTGGLQAEMRDAMSTIETEIKKATDIEGMSAEAATPAPATPYIFEPPAIGAAADVHETPTPTPGFASELVAEPAPEAVADVASAPSPDPTPDPTPEPTPKPTPSPEGHAPTEA